MDEGVIRQEIAQLRERYVNLFVLMERSLSIPADDAEADLRLAKLNADIATRMQAIGRRMRQLMQHLGDWPQRRQEVSKAFAEEVDTFFHLLDEGLHALQTQVDDRVESLREKQQSVAAAIRTLKRSRHGVRQYNPQKRKPKLFDSKA